MSDWIRRDYQGIGMTQSPPGRYLAALQKPYLGRVILCIDVSGSMATYEHGRTRLAHAVAGAQRFVAEAVDGNYEVGLILWDGGVHLSVPLSADPAPVLLALSRASIAGGTNVTPALQAATQVLGPLTGDRVIAVFGDGDIGAVGPAIAASRSAAALGIRIIVRGLGEYAAAALNQIATPDAEARPEASVVRDAGDIERAIASMASSLTIRRR
jgi:uncharacterized protein (DUF58 family)